MFSIKITNFKLWLKNTIMMKKVEMTDINNFTAWYNSEHINKC